MKSLVLDSSVVLKWFRSENEPDTPQALRIRRELEEGELQVVVPPVFVLEMLNVPGRKWGTTEPDLHLLADAISALEFSIAEVDPHALVERIASGLTAYDACYAALAEAHRVPLITADERLARLAPGVAISLRDCNPT